MKKPSAPPLEKFHDSANAIRNFMRASLFLLNKKNDVLACDGEQLAYLLSSLEDVQVILAEAVETALPYLEKTRPHDLAKINQIYLSCNALFNRLEDAKYVANALVDASTDKETRAVFSTVLIWVYLCYYAFTDMVNFIGADLLKTYPAAGPFPYRGHVGGSKTHEEYRDE
jgi:hypothetical protein